MAVRVNDRGAMVLSLVQGLRAALQLGVMGHGLLLALGSRLELRSPSYRLRHERRGTDIRAAKQNH
jgi:hypothetical protein